MQVSDPLAAETGTIYFAFLRSYTVKFNPCLDISPTVVTLKDVGSSPGIAAFDFDSLSES